MEKRNRASGWKYAKLSGHENESIIGKLMGTDEIYKQKFLSKINCKDKEIEKIAIGGLREKDVPSVLEGVTKSKVDMHIVFTDKTQCNVSIKKSTGGQVYLISVDRFIHGFKKQYNTTIPENVKLAISLFWGSNEDTSSIVEKLRN